MTASATDPGETVAVAPELPPERAASEWLPAIANALKLGSSLLLTLLIAIAMRFLMPRYLGPARFGTLSFADGFTATSFVVLSLGAEFYIRKEVSVRPAHASDFFGGTVLLRVGMAAVIFGIMALVMRATGRPPEVKNLVYLFGVAQFFVGLNATLSALLHARGQVGGMSVLAVATKLIWAAGVVAAIAWGTGLWGFAGAYLASESVETFVLFALARRHLGLVVRVDVPATKAMIVSCLPYFVNACASNAYNRLDVTVLGMMSAGREVGWYVAASSITGLTLLITPLIDWVLTPVFARGAVHSRERLYQNIRDATEPILTVAIPAALFVSVGADVWLRLLFGQAFAPAALALRVLAASSVVIYVAIVYAMTLIMMQRAWTLALISVAGLVLNLLLNLLLIRLSTRALGEGGAGLGCAVAALATHVFAVVAMVAFVGGGAISARTARMVGKSLAACGLVVLVDRLVAGIGDARVVVDVVVYFAVVVATGALRPLQLFRLAAAAVRSRRGARAGQPGEPSGQRA